MHPARHDIADEEGVAKFRTLRTQYKSVLPACDADNCKSKSNLGWACTGLTKKGVKDSKLAKREARDAKIAGKRDASFMSIDLKTVRIPRIEGDFESWLSGWLAQSMCGASCASSWGCDAGRKDSGEAP